MKRALTILAAIALAAGFALTLYAISQQQEVPIQQGGMP